MWLDDGIDMQNNAKQKIYSDFVQCTKEIH